MSESLCSCGSGIPASTCPACKGRVREVAYSPMSEEDREALGDYVRVARAGLECDDLDATTAHQLFASLVPVLLWTDDEATLEELLLLLERKHPLTSATLQYHIAEWRAEAALSKASDARPAGLRAIAENPQRHPDGFRQLFDRLHYHGAMSTLVELLPLAVEATSQLSGAGSSWHRSLQRELSFLRLVDAASRGEEVDPAELQPPTAWWWSAVASFFFGGARGDWTPKHLTGVFQPADAATRLALASLEFAHDLVVSGHNPTAAELARRGLLEMLKWQLGRKMKRSGRRTRSGKKVPEVNLQPKSLLLDASGVEDYLVFVTQEGAPSLYAATALAFAANPWNQFLASRSLVATNAAISRYEDLALVETRVLEHLLHNKCDHVLLNELTSEGQEREPNCDEAH